MVFESKIKKRKAFKIFINFSYHAGGLVLKPHDRFYFKKNSYYATALIISSL